MLVAYATNMVVDSIDTAAAAAADVPTKVVIRLAVAHMVDLVFVVGLETGADREASFDGSCLVGIVASVV